MAVVIGWLNKPNLRLDPSGSDSFRMLERKASRSDILFIWTSVIPIYNINKMSSSISELYSLAQHQSGYGIEGYHVDNKYVDAKALRLERSLSSSKSTTKPINVSKKTSFIDIIQKIAATLPGPTTYEPQVSASRSKASQSVIVAPKRKTIFDEMTAYQKKYNYPSAGKYDKVTTEVDRSRLKANLSKAENANYLQTSMRNSLDKPGVGNYNPRKPELDPKINKWTLPKNKSKSEIRVILPPVGTYNPVPVSFKLFESVNLLKGRSIFSRSERFKAKKEKTIPFYNVLCQWGMKNKLQKKDILSKVSTTSTSHRSVYY